MWEIATLGNIPTSTYVFAYVAFSLERDLTCTSFFYGSEGVGDRAVRFCPILLSL